jgi:hypothetical protein
MQAQVRTRISAATKEAANWGRPHHSKFDFYFSGTSAGIFGPIFALS